MAIVLPHTLRLKHTFAVVLICAVTTGCAGRGGEVLQDGLIGAGGGAIVGAVVPGISTGEGAAIGAAGGAAYGLLKDHNGNTIHNDERGNKYWIDKKGRRRYY